MSLTSLRCTVDNGHADFLQALWGQLHGRQRGLRSCCAAFGLRYRLRPHIRPARHHGILCRSTPMPEPLASRCSSANTSARRQQHTHHHSTVNEIWYVRVFMVLPPLQASSIVPGARLSPVQDPPAARRNPPPHPAMRDQR